MKVTVLVRKKSRNVEAVNQAVTIANRTQPEFEFDVEQSQVPAKKVVERLKRSNS
jgi:ACT domain-containing protein